MKRIILLVQFFISALTYAQIRPAAKGIVYGAEVHSDNAITVVELEKKLESKNEFTGSIKGRVVSVCQEKGCWMKLAKENGENIMVRFKDYKFFVPKNIDGKEVVLNGIAKKSITPVDLLKHYAKDAGKSDKEIAEINSPKNEIIVTASGVLVL